MRNDITLIKEALCRYSLLEAEATHRALQSADPPSPEFFTELDRRVAEIKKVKGGALTFKKAITALIAATLIIAVLAVTAYAISEKINIGGFFVEWFGDHLEATVEEPADNRVSWDKLNISYIPDGYINTNYTIDSYNLQMICEWETDSESIYLNCTASSGVKDFVNTEDNGFSIIETGDKTVFHASYPGSIYAMWTDGDIIYRLMCTNTTWDEMVKIIEGISYAAE